MLARPKYVKATIHSLALSGSVQPNCIGLHMNKSIMPTGVNFGIIRSHSYTKNYNYLDWHAIETSKGVFDWATADEWVNAVSSAGKEIIFQVSGTPAWAVAASAVGGSAYGGKTNMPPDNIEDYADFVAVLVARYGSKIQHYEGWNEPNLTKYWAGASATPAKLAAMQCRLYQVVKSIAPSATVLSPCFTSVFSGESGWIAYLAASDGAGGTGADWFDVASYHYYCNDNALRPTGLERMHRGVVRALATAGKSDKPVWATETGVITPEYRTLDASTRTTLMQVFILTLFALGVKRVLWFSVDATTIGFEPETAGVWNALYSSLVGRTLLHGQVDVIDQTTMAVEVTTDAGNLAASVSDMPKI